MQACLEACSLYVLKSKSCAAVNIESKNCRRVQNSNSTIQRTSQPVFSLVVSFNTLQFSQPTHVQEKRRKHAKECASKHVQRGKTGRLLQYEH